MLKMRQLRGIAIERLRAPLQLPLFAVCAGCGEHIMDPRDERRPAGAIGPVCCVACAREAEQQMPRAVKIAGGIEQMAAATSLEGLAGACLGYWTKHLGRALTSEETLVWQIAAYRHWQATHPSRKAA
jgi:hypothetical protein